MSERPLLSICLPCYNGGPYLPVVLEALLPQARELGNTVEVVIADDCSSDETTATVEACRALGPLRYIRNATNKGMARNIASSISEHATGEYVWVLSQHNVMRPGAVARVVNEITANPKLDAFYVNFRLATYPGQWPDHALGGYDGPFDYLCRSNVETRELERWEELLDATTSVGTQTYAHIVRRQLSASFLADKPLSASFTNALDTYTQTSAVAHTMFGRPAGYIGEPVLTIYNGAQTWSSLSHRAKVHLQGYPDLLRRYELLGWRGEKLKAAQLAGSKYAGIVIGEILETWPREERRLLASYLWNYWSHEGALAAIWQGFVRSRRGPVSQALVRTRSASRSAYQYLFSNWRPARWVRAHLK